ncbi:HNH endonuclease [Paenibacillus polysaccharolyticus]|uniref:HNH endonuclease n=1 Tax=Paenibacillus polysaccharolyticus TaxID=582692 RepID=UPI00203BC8E0|nr:HNH endonuclease signature motif containing protein [Paenibacillus polysaccharolyticus]MCM3131220.1 HNH endonuclease [Paenibacillus polysaccharolyticus]
MEFILFILTAYIAYRIYVMVYFRSDQFTTIQRSIEAYTANCNDLNHHIQELKNAYVDVSSYDYGISVLTDSSNYNFKRTEWNNNSKNRYVHNCSASVCKNASDQPFKYLCKYFDIKVTEESLSSFEAVLNDFEAAEQGKILLREKRDSIVESIRSSIPAIIYKFNKEKLKRKLGFEEIDFSTLYFPVYTFQYVSAGGNSSTKCEITLDINNLNKFVDYLNTLVKFRKSIAGQRALMTSALREKMKVRDHYTCQSCGISAYNEKHLLLEIDHIIPLSKGGETTESNLQTLCWKCNRTKGSKIIAS